MLQDYGRVQARCSEQMRTLAEKVRQQAQEIELLRAQSMRLRAEVIRRDTALAWAKADLQALQQAETGAGGSTDALESSLHAADLVICQTGCLSHGEFWRVQDHCKRTGKTCVMTEEPEALRIMRIHSLPEPLDSDAQKPR